MVVQLICNKKPCTIELRVKCSSERELFIIGYDPGDRYSVFFKRLMYPKVGESTFYFGMPQAPSNLKVVLYDNQTRQFTNSKTFEVVSLKKIPLRTAPTGAGKKTREYIIFIQEFCLKLPLLQPNLTYADDKKQFQIDLFPLNLEYATPARIEKTRNFIEVSKTDFLQMTIPQRIIILLHEYAHNFINRDQDSEVEADVSALKIYLGLGYPFIEGMYAFTHILHDSEMNIERLQIIEKYMVKHKLYIDK
uniref:Uncharacterized protein n=1 Tax=viral metagenome TaxID=1070528 RepID=A0A6M3J7R6_9ZZZZ